MHKPLNGYRILDLTRVLAGPYATMILADMGAEVIKIETPQKGDDARHFGPFIEKESAYFMSLNRNKKSITLDLKSEKGRAIFFQLIEKSDVVVENFRPGTMKKLGFDYDEIKKANPKIIYASCSGYGHSGPMKNQPAYDAVIQAMSGLMSITGQNKNQPTRTGASIADITSGMFTAIGILTALLKREKTGKGDRVDVAMLDSAVALLENAVARYTVSNQIPEPMGNRHPSITPFDTFVTKDDPVIIAVGNDRIWAVFCKLIDREEWIDHPDYQTNDKRNQNEQDLKEQIEEILKTNDAQYWVTLFEKNGVPVTKINTIKEVMEHPQLKQREMIVNMHHQTAGDVSVLGTPLKFEKSFPVIDKASPLLGEDTEELLKKLLNLSHKEYLELKKEQVT